GCHLGARVMRAPTSLRFPQKREMVMTIDSPFPTRRALLATSAAAIAAGLLPSAHAAAEDNAIRPFRVNVPEEALVDLRRRIQATRGPEKKPAAAGAGGAQRGQSEERVGYGGKDNEGQKREAKLTPLPKSTTTIEGANILSPPALPRHKDTLPVIVTHGWP